MEHVLQRCPFAPLIIRADVIIVVEKRTTSIFPTSEIGGIGGAHARIAVGGHI